MRRISNETTRCILYSSEEIKQIEENTVIEKIVIDFEEFAESVHYHMIPLWNLRAITEKTNTYPEPCIDKINYEHQILHIA